MTHRHLCEGECCCSSVDKSCLILCDPMDWMKHARLPVPLSPEFSVSCPLTQWYYITISSSVTLFSSCLQSFPTLGSFPRSELFASGGQSIGALASVLPMNIQGWFSFSSVQSCLTPCEAMDCSTPGFPYITTSQGLFKLKSIGLVMTSNHLILCHYLLLLPSIFPSTKVFSTEVVLHIRWPKHWSFSFSISPSNEYSGLISFRMDRLDLLEVQGTLKSLLQQHSSKASICQCLDFFIVQLSHPYMTTGKP